MYVQCMIDEWSEIANLTKYLSQDTMYLVKNSVASDAVVSSE